MFIHVPFQIYSIILHIRMKKSLIEKLSTAMGNVSKSNLIRIAITEYVMKYKNLLE